MLYGMLWLGIWYVMVCHIMVGYGMVRYGLECHFLGLATVDGHVGERNKRREGSSLESRTVHCGV